MSIQTIRDLKKVHQTVFKEIYFKNVVVGSQSFALHKVVKLHRDCLHLSTREISRQDFFPPFYENASCELNSEYYKEGRFVPFRSRGKSYELIHNEQDWVEGTPAYAGHHLEFSYDEQILKSCDVQHIVSIQKQVPQDFVEPIHWSLTLGDHRIINCENLFWFDGPHSFYSVWDKKDNNLKEILSNRSKDYVPLAQLSLGFEFSYEVTSKTNRLFLPLSATHRHGHFIGAFSPCTSNVQKGTFIHFFDSNEDNEEDLARKVKLLKRTLEKIFSINWSRLASEHISVFEIEIPQMVDNPQGELFPQTAQVIPSLYLH